MHDDEAPEGPNPLNALKDELWGQGVPDAAAGELIAAWEAHALATGIDRADPAYWRLAAAWIDEARGAS